MRHAAPISLPFSARCAYFPSPQGCTVIPSPLPRCLCVSTANRVFSAVCSLLSSLCALFCTRFLCFQQLAASFCKTPGVGYPGPLSTFRCAFCIPNVFTGPADIQTFRRGVPSVTCVFRSLPSVLRFFLQLALLSRACRLGQVVTARPPLRLPGRRIGWRRCRRIAPASLGGA